MCGVRTIEMTTVIFPIMQRDVHIMAECKYIYMYKHSNSNVTRGLF